MQNTIELVLKGGTPEEEFIAGPRPAVDYYADSNC